MGIQFQSPYGSPRISLLMLAVDDCVWIVQHDRAVFDFGNVTNDGSSNALDSDSMIYIEWDAVTIDTIENNTEYWVSAGAAYNAEDDIWVGQAGFMSLLDDYNTVSYALTCTLTCIADQLHSFFFFFFH